MYYIKILVIGKSTRGVLWVLMLYFNALVTSCGVWEKSLYPRIEDTFLE